MYKAFYSLKHKPFLKEVSSQDLFTSQAQKETLSRLKYLQQIRGMGVVTGEAGIGKTTYLRAFVSQLNPSLYKVVYFPLSTGTVMDFYRGIARALGETPQFRKVDLFHQIQQTIYKSFKDSRITPVLILDEMQLATPKFLSELTILFNFEMDSQNPFILILCGLDYFLDKLKLNQNRPLSQRVLIHYAIEPLYEAKSDLEICTLLAEKLGIEKPHKHVAAGLGKRAIKAEIRELKSKRDAAIEAGDKSNLYRYRKAIHRRKRKLRRMMQLD